ncbi:MAG: DUF1722 domain-containing protein [Gammaproteobacteria bacterium]|nr:DUF1722 domain-containing protein [Gammaproteobacteria bacterium]
MRIWDINPGYLNRQSLLGEHRELHGIVSIIKNNKKGYSKHPETLRWVGHGWALKQRHKLLVAEMNLRGYIDRSPVSLRSNFNAWPEAFIDTPADQFKILAKKYQSIDQGRIPLPVNAQQLWAQHKYSVMARDLSAYKNIGRWVASQQGKHALDDVAQELVRIMQMPPARHLVQNTLLHMWGYVSGYTNTNNHDVQSMSSKKLLKRIRQLVIENKEPYLHASTALGELSGWD